MAQSLRKPEQIGNIIAGLEIEALFEIFGDAARGSSSFDYPTEISHGDLSSNSALILAKTLNKNPKDVAIMIAAKLNEYVAEGKIPELDRVEVAGPGFVNFYFAKAFFADAVAGILKDEKNWGKNELFAGKKILVEHSSPNLFKAFHIGHVMNNAIGESIVRLANFSGADVTAISYPSDVSLGIGKAVWALMEDGGVEKLNSIGSSIGQIEFLGECYVKGTKAYDERPEIQARVREITANLYEKKASPELAVYEDAKMRNLAYFKAITATLGSQFKDFIFESEAGVEGKKIVDMNTGSTVGEEKVFLKSEGAVVYEGEQDGLHTRVFINKEGYPTYEAKDIGLLSLKFSRYSPDMSIFVTDHEQSEYFKVVLAAASKIEKGIKEGWAEKSIHRTHGRMSFKGQKMSSRLGGVPTAQGLYDFLLSELKTRNPELVGDAVAGDARSIAVAALKFSILRVMAGKNMDFDPETSLSFEGSSGPYLQYSAVRAASLVAKAGKAGSENGDTPIKPDATLPEGWKTTLLEQYLVRFPGVVEGATIEWTPHRLVGYLTELAQAFSSWYANTKIIDAADPASPYKVALTEAFRATMKNGLWLLGIETPERM